MFANMDTERICVVIPTRSRFGKPLTANSIPANVSRIVVHGEIYPAGKSRNYGALQCSHKDILIFADDDIIFEWSEVTAEFAKGFKKGYDIVSIHGSRLMAIPRTTFDELGGFDEEIKWWEDHDFLLRAALQGLKIKLLPWRLAEHKGTWRNRRWFTFWSQTNVIWFISKHGYFPADVFVPKEERKRINRKPRLIRSWHILLEVQKGSSPSWLLIRQLFRFVGFFTHLLWRFGAWLR